jgi:hypothetical protein
MSTNGVEKVGRERHVQHLFNENTGHDLGGFGVATTKTGRRHDV